LGERKLEILIFIDDAYGWIVWVECYFKLNSISQKEAQYVVACRRSGLEWVSLVGRGDVYIVLGGLQGNYDTAF